ncbi:MAG: FAD-binding oxidoreductase [Pseudomonadota bacterium]
MEFQSYWHATSEATHQRQAGPVEGHFDVAVVGAGFTGLNAARSLAKNGVKVAVLEAEPVGFGGSGRNGGHLNNGLAHGFSAAKQHLGAERAKALYQAYDRSIDMIEAVIAEEGIACDFRRGGKLKLASKASHVAGLKADFEVINAEVDPQTRWLERLDLGDEIGSDGFHGAVLYEKSAMMHMGAYVHGLATAAARHGAAIWEEAPVTARHREGSGWRLQTPRGALTADRVIAATGAYSAGRGNAFGYIARRLVPVGSYLIATRPLSEDEILSTMPGNRTCVTTMNIGHYFRLSADRRLIFGGRARFSARSDPASDAKSGRILQAGLEAMFPHLKGVDIDYCWGGLVGITPDRFPRAGEADGMIFGTGYSGHGAQMSTLIGQVLADLAMGRTDTNPLAGLDWPTVPFHSGKPWFLPFVGLWYGLKDRLS